MMVDRMKAPNTLWRAMLGLCLLVGALALGSPAMAQGMSMLETIRAANDAFESEDYQSAYDLYSEAYEQLPEPTILYRMGQAAENLGMYRVAIEHYTTYLDEGQDIEFIGRIAEVVPMLREKVPAILDVSSEPPGATIVAVDAEGAESELGVTPAQVDVGPGPVTVVVRADGYEEAIWQEEVDAEGSYSWAPELVAAPPALVVNEDPSRGEGGSLATWGWTTAGLGVAALATGGVFSLLQNSSTEEVNSYDKRADGASRDELDGLKDDATGYFQTARAAYIAGGVLTAAGVGMLIYNASQGEDAQEDDALSFEGGVGPQGGFVGLRGRF